MIRKIRGGFLLLAFAAVLVSCAGRPVYATEPSQDDAAASGESSETDSEEELTPEEALKKELDTVYQMEVQSNSWKKLAGGAGNLWRSGNRHGCRDRGHSLCQKY